MFGIPATGRTPTARTDGQPVDTGLQISNRRKRDSPGTAAAAAARGTAAAAAAAAGERNLIVAFNQLRSGQVRNPTGPGVLCDHGDKTLLIRRSGVGLTMVNVLRALS